MEMRSERRALDKLYKRRDRYEIPDWQRKRVWSIEKKRRLIDSILRGWKLPKLYFQKTNDNPEEFDVVDGQQRLTAIWEFYGGELSLAPDSAARFGGAKYKELPPEVSDAFDDFEIEYDEITNATDEDIKDFFRRLQAGLPLTSSEKLNAVHSQLRDFCAQAASDPFFSQTTVVANKRHAHFDIVAKVAVLEIEGLNAGLRFDEIERVFEANAMFSSQSAAAKRILRALKLLREQFPAPYKPFRNRTIVQALITFVIHLQEAGLKATQSAEVKEFIESFLADLNRQVELGQLATDQDLLAFQRTVNANIKLGARTRQMILLRKLLRRNPSFFSALDQSSSFAAGIDEGVKARGSTIRELVAACNERFSAKHGSDLFKPTNKTATALARIGTPIKSRDDYKTFISDLYFLFREGIGQRLNDHLPPSFVDVNDLRTMLQHDVDHGETSKAAAKRKRLGAVFARYAGASSPDAVAPFAFPVLQLNILAALEADLIALSRSLSPTS